jgi:hypothetical protein
MAAYEYWMRLHAGEPRDGLLQHVASEHDIQHQELSAAIVRFVLGHPTADT